VRPPNDVSPTTPQSILVVEDDEDLRRVFRDSLRFAGFEVREAADGPAALRMIESSCPNLVVLDLGLPTLDGVSVREEIAAMAATRHLPIVIVTGLNVEGTLFKADRVLRKPVSPDQLVAIVRDCLRH
jgi:DNA-binding response OmpR family regulator